MQRVTILNAIILMIVDIPGVIGGEPALVQFSPARMLDVTSTSQPCFTPSMFSENRKFVGGHLEYRTSL